MSKWSETKYDFYDNWFKATAVELGALPGVQVLNVADVLDIHPIMLYRWKKEVRDGDIMTKPEEGTLGLETRRELKRLKKIEKAHETLKMEHALLKKASSTVRIGRVFGEVDGIYGSPKIHEALRQEGILVEKHRV